MGFAGLRGYFLLLCQAGALIQTVFTATWTATWYLPIALVTAVLRQLLPGCDGSCDGSARFYEVRKAAPTPAAPPRLLHQSFAAAAAAWRPTTAALLCCCLVQGTVMHTRKQPKQHRFRCGNRAKPRGCHAAVRPCSSARGMPAGQLAPCRPS
jgi:hypothetical protein